MTFTDKLALVPFAKLFLTLSVGIVVGMNLPAIFPIGSFFVLILLTLLYFLFSSYRILLAYLMLFTLGCSLPYLQYKEEIPLNTNIEKTLKVIDTTSKKGILICRLIDDHQKIAIIWDTKNDLSAGDTIKATIQIENLQFAHYTLKKAVDDKTIKLSAKVIGDGILIKGTNNPKEDEPSLLRKINNWCSERLSTLTIDPEDIAIIDGMLLGNRDNINKKQIKDYQAGGISHILSISGMHISILFMMLNILFIFKNRFYYLRLTGSVFIIVLLWVYTLIVGSPVSAVRATLMFSILQISMIRVFSPLQTFNTLFATATLFLLIDHTLIKDLSFQLSFTAMLSILLFMPYFSLLTKRMPYLVAFIPNIIFVSIAAQILTTPLILHYFGYFSIVSIATNVVGSIAITAIMILSIGYIIVPNSCFETGIEWSFKVLNNSLDYLLQLPCSHLEKISFSTIDVIIYLILVVMILKYTDKYLFRL